MELWKEKDHRFRKDRNFKKEKMFTNRIFLYLEQIYYEIVYNNK